MKKINKIMCLDIAVCSSWGTRLPKHIFYDQFAPKRGYQYCLNCGFTKAEARAEDVGTIEYRPIDVIATKDLTKPVFLSEDDLKNGNYRVYI